MNPTSFSELESLNRCEKLWDYEWRRGLVPKREEARLDSGTVMHRLLRAYHSPVAKYDRSARWLSVWQELRTKALDAAVLVEESEEIDKQYDLFFQIMQRFDTWNQRITHEPFSFSGVAFVEETFTVQIVGLPVPLKIKPDLVLRLRNGQFWVRDFKTKLNFDKNMELRLDYDPQLSFFILGLRNAGWDVAGADHVYIRMRVPQVPAVNKDGSMSLSRIVTDEETVRQFLTSSGATCDPIKLDAYLARLPKDAFFRRIETIRTDGELEAIGKEIALKTDKRNMLQAGLMQPTRSLQHDCTRCPFLRPCVAGLKGGDEDEILEELYRPRRIEEDKPADFLGGEEEAHDETA